MAEKDDIRNQIVEAAKKRFSHFGYAKTTMAEVATDCSMSPGNLYRFFPGKLDIAEFIATEGFNEHLAELEALVAAGQKSARQRLQDVFFTQLRRTFQRLENNPRAFEIALIISRERPEFANWMLANERKLLVTLVDEGRQNGEFADYGNSSEETAEMMQSALLKFHYPQLWSKLTLEKLERELSGVLSLIFDGLSPRQPTSVAA